MYNLIIRNKELTVIPAKHVYNREGDLWVGQFKTYQQVEKFLLTVELQYANVLDYVRNRAANFNKMQTVTKNLTPYSQALIKVAKPAAVAKKVTRRSNEELEDMGLGHTDAYGFMRY